MSIRKILLTPEGDELVLPKQPRVLHDGLMREIPARQRVLSDKEVEGLKLGKYPMEGMFSINPQACGAPTQYAAYEIMGEHGSCGSNLELKNVSRTHQAIVCNECHLRVPIPRKVKTYSQLQTYMAKHVRPAKR